MKKWLIGSLLICLVLPGINVSAQVKGVAKALTKSNEIEHATARAVARAHQLVPLIPEYSPPYYIPESYPVKVEVTHIDKTVKAAALANQLLSVDEEFRAAELFSVPESDTFDIPALSYEEGLSVLHESQAKFAQARANGEYESAWKEFQATKKEKLVPYYGNLDTDMKEFYALGGDMFQKGKVYTDPTAMAIDIYNFHMQKLNTQQVPQVKNRWGDTDSQGVYEIPVDGLQLLVYDRAENIIKDISPENFVVLATPTKACLVYRGTFEDAYVVEPDFDLIK